MSFREADLKDRQDSVRKSRGRTSFDDIYCSFGRETLAYVDEAGRTEETLEMEGREEFVSWEQKNSEVEIF